MPIATMAGVLGMPFIGWNSEPARHLDPIGIENPRGVAQVWSLLGLCCGVVDQTAACPFGCPTYNALIPTDLGPEESLLGTIAKPWLHKVPFAYGRPPFVSLVYGSPLVCDPQTGAASPLAGNPPISQLMMVGNSVDVWF